MLFRRAFCLLSCILRVSHQLAHIVTEQVLPGEFHSSFLLDNQAPDAVRLFQPSRKLRMQQLLYSLGKDLLDKSPDYNAGFLKQSKGAVADWDRWDFDEFIYYLKGRMKVEDYDDGKTYIVKKGDFVHIKRGSKLKQIFEEDCEAFFVMAPKWGLSMERRD